MVSNLMAGYFHFLTSHFAVPHGGNSIVGYYHLESTASKKNRKLSISYRFFYKKKCEQCSHFAEREVGWTVFLQRIEFILIFVLEKE